MSNSAFGLTGAFLALPPGAMVDFAGTVAPAGWLMADGSAISRAVYSNLFQAIGVTYGVGDNSTTFNLPDFRGRFARYMDNMGTAAGAAGRDTGRVLSGTAQAQATAKNGLAVTNNAVTSAGMSANSSHSHSFTMGDNTGGTYPTASGARLGQGTLFTAPGGTGVLSADISHTHSVTSNVTLGLGDAETRPINLACHRIIKV